MPDRPRAVRLPAAPRRYRFRSRLGFQIRPSPDPFESGSFSRVRTPLRSSFASLPAAPSEAARTARVSSLTATSPKVSTHAGHPNSRYGPSSGFLNLSTAFSTFGFAGLLHPAATPRVHSPFRGFSRPAVVPARRRSVPPCRSDPTAHRHAGCHDRAPRLRGFTPRCDAFLGVGV